MNGNIVAKLKYFQKDERKAVMEYDEFADELKRAGFHREAEMFRQMADDEWAHDGNVTELLARLEERR